MIPASTKEFVGQLFKINIVVGFAGSVLSWSTLYPEANPIIFLGVTMAFKIWIFAVVACLVFAVSAYRNRTKPVETYESPYIYR